MMLLTFRERLMSLYCHVVGGQDTGIDLHSVQHIEERSIEGSRSKTARGKLRERKTVRATSVDKASTAELRGNREVISCGFLGLQWAQS